MVRRVKNVVLSQKKVFTKKVYLCVTIVDTTSKKKGENK